MHVRLLATAASFALGASLVFPASARADATPECNVGAGYLSTECGIGASASGDLSTAVGQQSTASGIGGTATGVGSSATNDDTTATGAGATASGLASTATGTSSKAIASGTTATGTHSFASGLASTATGASSHATGSHATATGAASTASGSFSTATGADSHATGSHSTAVGFDSDAGGPLEAPNTTAIGANSSATGISSTALGQGATATATGSVALGQGSVADEENTVSVGSPGAERQIVNVAAGDVSATSTDAVNGSQLHATNQRVSALEQAHAVLPGHIEDLFDLRERDQRDLKQGVAAAIAIANAPMPSAPGRVSYAVNGATFRGEYAVGGSLMYRLPTANPMAINVGVSHAGNRNTGIRIGVAGEF